jgi:hypothetical protein
MERWGRIDVVNSLNQGEDGMKSWSGMARKLGVLVSLLAFVFVVSSPAQSEVVFEKEDVTITLESEVEAEYDVYNFDGAETLVQGADQDRFYGAWDNTVAFGLTAEHTDMWTGKYVLEFAPLSDDDASVGGSEGDLEPETIEAYIDYNSKNKGFYFTVGRVANNFGTHYLFYGDEEDTGARAGFNGENYMVTVGSYVNDETGIDDEDRNMHYAELIFDLNENNYISVYDVYIDENEEGSKADLHNLALSYTGSLNAINVNADVNYQFGDAGEGDNEQDFAGYAGIATVEYAADKFAPYVTLGYGSGDDDQDDDTIDTYQGVAGDLASPLLAFDTSVLGATDSENTLSNAMLGTVGVGIQVNDKLSLTPSLSYIQRVEDVDVKDQDDNVVGQDDSAGTEANLICAYDFSGPVEFEAIGAYMLTDEGIGYEDPENAYGIEAALTMSF